MRVFVAVTSLQPEYGGPARSVSRLSVALAEAGIEVGLWAPDESPSAPLPTTLHWRMKQLAGSASQALDRFGRVDILHDNGLWRPHNHALARLARSRGIARVVSTRGMLEPWALNHRRLKKKAAWWLYQRRDLQNARCHHATALQEADNVRRLGLGVPVHVIPNGIDVIAADEPTSQDRDASGMRTHTRTAIFLGRIYPVKGLPMLIEAWARVRPLGWELKIAGPDEGGHQKQIEWLVTSAGLHQQVSFVGPVEGEAKRRLMSAADLMILPSHSESFGMVVGEALAHGTPVLTTKAVPWPMLPTRECGWWVEPTVQGLIEGLEQATALDRVRLQSMGNSGRRIVEAEFSWGSVANAFGRMYQDMLSRRSRL